MARKAKKTKKHIGTCSCVKTPSGPRCYCYYGGKNKRGRFVPASHCGSLMSRCK